VTLAAVCNLPLRMRVSFQFVQLLSVVVSKYLKSKGGLLWSIAGRNDQGQVVMDDALTSEFEQLERGVPVMLPDDDNPDGDLVQYIIEGHFCLVSADWLAAQAFGFTVESASATHPCGECHWTSFAAQRRQRKREANGDPISESETEPALRTHAELLANASRMIQEFGQRQLSKTALKKQLTELGMNKVRCALQYMPRADSVRDTPPDVMHLFGCGTSRTEGVMKLRILFKDGSGLSVANPWAKLNFQIDTLNMSLPRGKRLPHIYPPAPGKKINEMHLDLNASETFLYVMHSVTLVEPLLTERGRQHPAWRSWLAHRAVVAKCLQHSIAESEADGLATLIKAHEAAFDRVIQYDDLERPKHHFQKHLPDALRRHGLFRAFWCMPWEAFLQLIKRIIHMGNFKKVAYHVCEFWSMKSALVYAGHSNYVDKLGDEIVHASELNYDMISTLQVSPLMQIAATHSDTSETYAARGVSSFTREPMEVRSGDWLLVTVDGSSYAGRAGEIMELFLTGGRTVLRMMLLEAQAVLFEDDTRGGVITVSRDADASDMYIRVEDAALHEVHCEDVGTVRTFTYVY